MAGQGREKTGLRGVRGDFEGVSETILGNCYMAVNTISDVLFTFYMAVGFFEGGFFNSL